MTAFQDDLFAFTIKMPTLHRLATLRDDVIFFVYLYQGWKYKVDYTRVIEFGQGGDDEQEGADVAAKVPSKALTSPADGERVDVADAEEIGSRSSAREASGKSGGSKKRK